MKQEKHERKEKGRWTDLEEEEEERKKRRSPKNRTCKPTKRIYERYDKKSENRLQT